MNQIKCDECKVLKLVWKGKKAIKNNSVDVVVNDVKVGTYSYSSNFDVEIPITCNEMNIVLLVSGRKLCAFKLSLDLTKSYVCDIVMGSWGIWGYELKSETGLLLKSDRLSLWKSVLFALIPIIGLIYFIAKIEEYPSKAKSALMATFYGLMVSIVLYCVKIYG